MVAAASVVLKPVRPHTIVAGVPAVEVGDATFNAPSEAMIHDLPNTEQNITSCCWPTKA